MCTAVTLVFIISILSFDVSLTLAQQQPTGGTVHLTLTMPDSAAAPSPGPQVNAEALGQLFGLIDANHDGVLAPGEFYPWVTEYSPTWIYTGAFHVVSGVVTTYSPVITTYGTWTPTQGTGTFHPTVIFTQGIWTSTQGTWSTGSSATPSANSPPQCPECSAELADQEQRTFFPNTPCGASAGSLRLRTVCNMQGRNSQSVYLPDGYDADCFSIQAQTGNQVAVVIYPENSPNTVIYDSRRDGLDHLGAVHLSDTGIYRIDLDMTASGPGARVTVAFVGHPE